MCRVTQKKKEEEISDFYKHQDKPVLKNLENWTFLYYLQSRHVLKIELKNNGPNHLVQRTSCRISIGRPLDSTGCLLEFCNFSSNVLLLPISSRNAIKISTRHPVKFRLDVHQNLLDIQLNCSTGRSLELMIWRNIAVASQKDCLVHFLAKLIFMKRGQKLMIQNIFKI